MERGGGRPNPIDVHVGSRVRLRRTLVGMSQEKLGEAIGLSFQQLQKYERGSNRIGASRLFDLARVLDVPVGFFFDAMSEDVAARSPGQSKGTASEAVDVGPNPLPRAKHWSWCGPTTRSKTLPCASGFSKSSRRWPRVMGPRIEDSPHRACRG